MSIRIQRSRATVKALYSRLQQAYRHDEVRWVRRPPVLLDWLGYHVPVAVVCERWGLSPSCLSPWRQAVLLPGVASRADHHGGGRGMQRTPRPRQRLSECLEAGPHVVGVETACGDAVHIRVRIWRACGVRYNRPDVCTLLHHLGLALHKARLVSDPLDAARRPAWLRAAWPTILRAAQRRQGLRLVEDAASVAPWGAFSSTWARRGHQPAVLTSGTRKGSKVFGAMDSVSGRLCSQGMEGRFNAASSQAFWQTILAHTTAPLFLLPDGARW